MKVQVSDRSAYASGGEAWKDMETVTKEPVQTAKPGANACGIRHTRYKTAVR